MAKLPNRLVIEITDTNKVDELGNPVISFESKDYAECVIEELEKIKKKIYNTKEWHKIPVWSYEELAELIDDYISELEGETNDRN